MTYGFTSNCNGVNFSTDKYVPGYVLETLEITSTSYTDAQISAGSGWITRNLLATTEFSRYAVFINVVRPVKFVRVVTTQYGVGFLVTTGSIINIPASTYQYRFNYYDVFNPTDNIVGRIQLIGY